MPVVHDGAVGERAEVRERAVHLVARALEEAAAPSDEERVAGEDAPRLGRVRSVSDVVAY